MQMLYLIDGHAQMYRSYHAIRGSMSSPVTGEPTNASFAFSGMLLKLFEQQRPENVVLAIDKQGPTFRHALYADYKATRPPPPEELEQQIPRMLEITRLLGIDVVGADGAEADDVLATLTQQTLLSPDHEPMHVRIVSKDKDLEQLIGPRVSLFDIHTDMEMDQQTLAEKKGISPAQVIDVLCLIGDKIDNIPGIEGVGPKTAAKLIGEYESLDNLLANLDQLKGKRRESFEKGREFLSTARELVTLKRDLELEITPAQTRLGQADVNALRHVFKTLGFNRHLSDLDRLVDDGVLGDAETRSDTRGHGQGLSAALGGGEPGAGAGAGQGNPRSEFAASLFEPAQVQARARANVVDEQAQTSDDPGPGPAQLAAYWAITSEAQLRELVQTLGQQSVISVDVETIGLGRRAGLCGICLAWQEGEGVYVPTCSPKPDEHLDERTVLDALGTVLESTRIAKVGHNVKYDLQVLANAGLTLRGVAFDTMIAAFLLGRPGRGLDSLALAELQYEMRPITQLIGARPRKKSDPPQRTMDQVPLEQVTPYAAEDADITLRLYHRFKPEIDQSAMTRLSEDIETPLIEVLAEMENHGIRCDPAVLDQQRAELQVRIDQLRSQILDAAGVEFNPDSTKQLGEVLFDQLEFPTVKRTRTGYSTDVEVLERLAQRVELGEVTKVPEAALAIPNLLIEYRSLTKLVSTYLTNLHESIDERTGRVHTSFVQTGAATGRLSSNNPNLQNIPVRTDLGRQIRKAFVAEANHQLIAADYSQIELRVLAHLSEDENLIKAFNAGEDIHTTVAARVFGVEREHVTAHQRANAKVINFGIVYGVTAFGLARRIDDLDKEAAAKLIQDYKHQFPGIDRFLAQCVNQATEHGYVTTMMGRRRTISEIAAKGSNRRQLGQRLAINTVVQGSAADLIKAAMVQLSRRIHADDLPLKPLLQIHDELIAEAPSDRTDELAQVMVEVMENATELLVPLEVDPGVGENWFDCK